MRFLRLLLIIFCAAALCVTIPAFNAGTCFEEGESYTFFCGDTSKDCRIVTVKRGAALKKLALDEVCGESTTYPSLDVNQFLEDAHGQVIFCEQLSDSVNYYCTADLPYSVELYGTRINLHICVKEGRVTVASPIIFGGY